MGPTASGKTAVAERLADHLHARLVNADAFQVYRGLDVGTSKPVAKERYDLLDIKAPDETFGVGEWIAAATAVLGTAWADGNHVVVVGGTGLYIRALFEEYAEMYAAPDPDLREAVQKRLRDAGVEALFAELTAVAPQVAAGIDAGNPRRVSRALERVLAGNGPMRISIPPFRKTKLALDPPKATLDVQIRRRLDIMFQNGWVREVERLRAAGIARSAPSLRAIGYQDVWDHIEGVISFEIACERITTATRRYAKRQGTWLRSEPNLLRLAGNEPEALYAEAMERIAR
jgi:tRNA dimethylallyltransferase